MKYIVMSDLHLEFTRTNYLEVAGDTSETVLILAGDVHVGYLNLLETIQYYCTEFAEVVYVPGNHDHYGTEWGQLQELLEELDLEISNFHYLNRRVITIKGVKIGGATMWGAPESPHIYSLINDGSLIRGLDYTTIVEEGRKDTEWIYEQDVDILVTHFCPSPALGNPFFEENELTPYFCPKVLENAPEGWKKPKVWAFGHTHYSLNRDYKGIKFISNQVGYPQEYLPFYAEEHTFEVKRTSNNVPVQTIISYFGKIL